MTDIFKKIIGTYVAPDEQEVLNAINNSGLKSMRVVGRGTLTVDTKEVTNSPKFKEYVQQAKQIAK
ncbi:hypothetical protein MNBD_GAMMA12-1352 [hydrothermal vent metagenome]|uniref:Uncharacterized protein n=1 Tax=hydrothermal vent metagenome TaxID=652676 RepID=A0A3B0Z513_9ZZZZ